MKKRTVSLVIAGMVVAAGLAGCSSKTSGTDSSTQEVSETTDETTETTDDSSETTTEAKEDIIGAFTDSGEVTTFLTDSGAIDFDEMLKHLSDPVSSEFGNLDAYSTRHSYEADLEIVSADGQYTSASMDSRCIDNYVNGSNLVYRSGLFDDGSDRSDYFNIYDDYDNGIEYVESTGDVLYTYDIDASVTDPLRVTTFAPVLPDTSKITDIYYGEDKETSTSIVGSIKGEYLGTTSSSVYQEILDALKDEDIEVYVEAYPDGRVKRVKINAYYYGIEGPTFELSDGRTCIIQNYSEEYAFIDPNAMETDYQDHVTLQSLDDIANNTPYNQVDLGLYTLEEGDPADNDMQVRIYGATKLEDMQALNDEN